MSNLYIVATPIGNLQDITVRAARILLESKIIIAESTSKTGILLEFLKKQFPQFEFNQKQTISLTEDEEQQKIPSLIKLIEKQDAALTSEAGTPLISDPGFKLVREAIKNGIRIIPIPGSGAPVAALSASGLPTDKFLFLGYLPKSQNKKAGELLNLKNMLNRGFSPTIIFFESPHRLSETLSVMLEVLGDIEIVIARELTKIHEEITHGKLSEIIDTLGHKTIKGELTLLFNPKIT